MRATVCSVCNPVVKSLMMCVLKQVSDGWGGIHVQPRQGRGQCFVKGPSLDRLPVHFCRLVDRLSGHLAKHWRRVMTVSFHRYGLCSDALGSYPFFPGTGDVTDRGERHGKNYSVNVPLKVRRPGPRTLKRAPQEHRPVLKP